MNKKLQSMYRGGGLIKALLKDPAQAKMAMEILGKQATAAQGMAVNKSKLGMPGTAVPGAKNTYGGGGVAKKYRAGGMSGGQNGPGGGLLARLFGKKKEEEPPRQTAKQAWQEAGYEREPLNWDRTTQSTRDAVNPKFYEGFNPLMSNTQNRGNVYGVNSFNADPSTAEQIAREIRSQMTSYDDGVSANNQPGGLATYGANRYQAVIPTVEDIMWAIDNTSHMMKPGTKADGSPWGYGGSDQMTPMDVIKAGMTEYAGPTYSTGQPGGGDAMFDAILAEAMQYAQGNFDTRLKKARETGRYPANAQYRDVRDGETKEEFFERRDRGTYAPEMKEQKLLNEYADRLYESSYFGDEGYQAAQSQAQADIRNAVIDMLNEAAGSNIYDRYRGQSNYFLQ